MVGHNLRSSILDHVYFDDPTVITNLRSTRPFFGDHLMVEFCVNGPKTEKKAQMKCDWRNYSGDLLNANLITMDWEILFDDVQAYWNCFESKLIKIIDMALSP